MLPGGFTLHFAVSRQSQAPQKLVNSSYRLLYAYYLTALLPFHVSQLLIYKYVGIPPTTRFFMRIYSIISKKVRKLEHLSDMVRQEYDRTCTVNGSY